MRQFEMHPRVIGYDELQNELSKAIELLEIEKQREK